MRSGLRIDLALCVALALSLIVMPAPRASAAGAPVAVDAAIVLAADVSRSIDDEEFALSGAAMRTRSRASNSSIRSPPGRTARSRSLTSSGPATARSGWWSTGR